MLIWYSPGVESKYWQKEVPSSNVVWQKFPSTSSTRNYSSIRPAKQNCHLRRFGGDAHQATVRCAAGATCQEEENSKVIEYVLRLNKSLEHSSSHNQMEKIEERNQKQKIYNRHDTTVAPCVGIATRLPGELWILWNFSLSKHDCRRIFADFV